MSVAVRVEFALRGCMFEVLDEAAFGTSVRAGNFLVELGLLRCLGNTHVAQGAASWERIPGTPQEFSTRVNVPQALQTTVPDKNPPRECPIRQKCVSREWLKKTVSEECSTR